MAAKLPPYKQVPVDRLVPYARNARTHSQEQVEQIAASISEFGFLNPVIVDGGGQIIAGHGRVLAAKHLKMQTVPTIEVSWLSETQRRAYILADNKLALNAGWDDSLLRIELADLRDNGTDLAILGFSDDDLAVLFEPANGETGDPEETPDPPATPVSVIGDVWCLGQHRLACGSCTDAAVVEAVLAGAKPHLMVTDPPYGVEYDANWRNERARTSAGMGNRALGAGAVGKVLNDDLADWRAAYALFPGEVAYAWSAGLRSKEAIEGLEASGFQIRAQIIWAKQQFAIGRGDYHFQHEPCWYAVRKGKTGHWVGGRKQTTLWEIPKPAKSETGHSTQKPIECMRRPIVNNSKAGDAVYEPFMGSGTTLIAAEMTGRVCYGIELNPAYVDVAVLRWQGFTGKQAVRESDGLAFNDLLPALSAA